MRGRRCSDDFSNGILLPINFSILIKEVATTMFILLNDNESIAYVYPFSVMKRQFFKAVSVR